jgi:hypothetical protein
MSELSAYGAPVEGRSCGTCTLCCKILGITELSKPKDKWCPHCEIGRGCKVYDRRPAECSGFFCGYLQAPLASYWRPDTAKMVVVAELDGNRLAVHVDPGRPVAWRDEPFYSDIKQWALSAAADMKQVVVTIGRRVIVILPDRDVDLGLVADDERIVVGERMTEFGPRLDALKLKADDPRIAGAQPGVVYRSSHRIR